MNTDSVMLRLREANPYADGAAAANDALFARITAQPKASRPTRRRYRRPFAVALAALIALAVLASTAFAISKWLGADVVKPDVTKAEYRDAQQQLVLPPGASWPALHIQANSVTTRGGGGGYAVVIAQNAWECYWVRAMRIGDERAAMRAHARLDTLLRNNIILAPAGAPENWAPTSKPNRPQAVYARDGGYEWLRETYSLAATGKLQRLAQRCSANSPG